MIYDKILTICTLLPGRSPAARKLGKVSQHYYAERSVYASRFYAGRQAGARARSSAAPRGLSPFGRWDKGARASCDLAVRGL